MVAPSQQVSKGPLQIRTLEGSALLVIIPKQSGRWAEMARDHRMSAGSPKDAMHVMMRGHIYHHSSCNVTNNNHEGG